MRKDATKAPFLVELAIKDDVEAMQAFAVLPYFKELLNEETEDGWTPILAASA